MEPNSRVGGEAVGICRFYQPADRVQAVAPAIFSIRLVWFTRIGGWPRSASQARSASGGTSRIPGRGEPPA